MGALAVFVARALAPFVLVLLEFERDGSLVARALASLAVLLLGHWLRWPFFGSSFGLVCCFLDRSVALLAVFRFEWNAGLDVEMDVEFHVELNVELHLELYVELDVDLVVRLNNELVVS